MDGLEQISEGIERGITKKQAGTPGIASFLGWQCTRKGGRALRIASYFQGGSRVIMWCRVVVE
jgi:hypothetical protein